MEKQNQDFSMQEAMKLIQSPAGQQLLHMLQNSSDPALQRAMEQATRGDIGKAKQSLQHLIADEEIQKLLTQLGG